MLYAIVDQLLRQLHSPLPNDSSTSSRQLSDPSHPWQCKAASVICVLSETIFGASHAWPHPWHDLTTTHSSPNPSLDSSSSPDQGHDRRDHEESPGRRSARGPSHNSSVGRMHGEGAAGQMHRGQYQAPSSVQNGSTNHQHGNAERRQWRRDQSRPPELDIGLMVMILEELVHPCIRNLATSQPGASALISSLSQQVWVLHGHDCSISCPGLQ